jgi:hypothetical protein
VDEESVMEWRKVEMLGDEMGWERMEGMEVRWMGMVGCFGVKIVALID